MVNVTYLLLDLQNIVFRYLNYKYQYDLVIKQLKSNHKQKVCELCKYMEKQNFNYIWKNYNKIECFNVKHLKNLVY